MKKLTLLLVLVMIGSAAFTQLDPFMPPNPITFAQGGAFTANAEGMNAFFYNPAGFRHDNGELTLTSVGVYSLIDRSLLDLVLSTTGVASGVSRQSELGLPPGYEELEALAADLVNVSDWYSGLTVDDQQRVIDAAIVEIESIDSELAASLGDTSNLTQEELIVIVLESPIFEDGADGETNLTNILQAMDGATVDVAAGDLTTQLGGVGWETTMDSNARAAKETIPGGEMRIGALAGVAYTGNGIGLGLFINADGSFDGDTILNSKGRFMTSVSLAGGLAIPIGPFTVGAQVRPTILGYTDIYPAELLLGGGDPSAIFGSAVYTGFYLGVDAGALYDLGPFTFGVAVKDILPFVQWSSYASFDEYLAGLQGGQLLSPEKVASQDGLYKIPFAKINVGAQFHPNLGPLNWIVDPRINVDIHDVLGFFRYINQEQNPLEADKATLGTGYDILELLHIGAEADFLGGLLSARAGFYGDYLTAGIGAHLLFLDINAAVGASDLGETPDGNVAFRQLGLSLEVALRF